MEFNISDLLDDLSEVNVDIQPNTRASAERIKGLTMKKIHSEKKQCRRSLSKFSKILIAVAAIAALAGTAAATAVFHATDWLDVLFVSGKQDDSADTSQDKWVIRLSAKNVDATGMEIVCERLNNPEKVGTISTDNSFWLEKWNGQDYDRLPDPAKGISAGETVAVQLGDTETWKIDWTGAYGVLPSGGYRLGKSFIYTSDSGEQETMTEYVKFRVYTEDMAPYIESCKACLEELRTRDSYHLTETTLGDNLFRGEAWDCLSKTYWKNGDHFLVEYRYLKKDGTLISHKGYLFREGKGYKLTWSRDSVLSGVASWEAVDWINEMTRDMWSDNLRIYDMAVGEVYSENNTTHLLLGYPNQEIDYQKITYTVDTEGRLTSAQVTFIPWLPSLVENQEAAESYAIEIYDSSTAEIAKIIAAQNVGRPASFSWEVERTKYPAGTEGVKTEGFVNTTSQTVNLQNVVSMAQKECTLEWQNTAVVYCDEGAQVWKVELGFSQDGTICQTVYLSNDGITLLVVTE